VASDARRAFDSNCKDVDRLLKVHVDLTGNAPGRRYGVEVLNKSAIVLITAFWEAYCEDIAAEALQHLVTKAGSSDLLPEDLRKNIAKELKADQHELATWRLADDGWRKVIKDRLGRMQEERNRRLNTPKSAQIDELFDKALGLPRISSAWYWKSMPAEQARAKLDKYVTLRGEIAHRGAASGSVKKTQVNDYYRHVKRLVGKTGGRVNNVVKKATGEALW
jgi:hypothetical protein